MKNRHRYCDAKDQCRGLGVTKNRTFIYLAIGRWEGVEGGMPVFKAFWRNPFASCVCNISSENAVSLTLCESLFQPVHAEWPCSLVSKKRGYSLYCKAPINLNFPYDCGKYLEAQKWVDTAQDDTATNRKQRIAVL